MTFTEAAVQVLRLVGKPLHYKEITDVAIEKELLSHVGKSPEVTMGARLAAVVKKGGGDNPLTRVKPGVFALAEWDAQTVEQGLNDRTPALRKLAKLEAEQAAAGPAVTEAAAAVDGEHTAPTTEIQAGLGQDEIARAELTAAATELFAPEDDDDEPLLGREDEEVDSDEEPDVGKRGRRRRRRRGHGGERDDDDLPTYTVSEVSEDALVEVSAELRDRSAERGPDRPRGADRERGAERERGADRQRGADRGGDRDRGGGDRERSLDRGGDRERGLDRGADRDRNLDRGADRGSERDDRDAERDRDRHRNDRGENRDRPSRVGEEDSPANDLPFLVEQALGNHRRQGGATFRQLAEGLQRRVRGVNDLTQLSQWLSAACRTDNFRRQAQGDRARFRLGQNGRVALWEWAIDRDQVRLEKEARVAVDRYQDCARQRLLKRLVELPPRAFGEFAQLLLEAQDFGQFRPVKRPTAAPSEVHLAAVQRTALGELPVALCIRRDGRDVGREQVVDLRGSLHYYGPVSLGVIVTAGQVMSGAREEAAIAGATPVHFIDGMRLAKLCDQTGVGVMRQTLSITLPDVDLFDSLRANG